MTLKVVFMGTPVYAVPCLQALLNSPCQVVTVVTQPDRPQGRGRKFLAPPVKILARNYNLPILQPERVREPAFIATIADLAPDVIVVVAFGQLLPEALMATARLGALNLHASLLPRYRGPAPIQWAIVNGDKMTGVTAMQMDAGLDTGPVLDHLAVPIYANDTAGTLHDRLAQASASLLLPVLAGWSENRLQPCPQAHPQATTTRLLTKKDGHINWQQSARAIDAFVRGMNPWPGAFSFLGRQRLKIWRVQPLSARSPQPPGTRLPAFESELRIATAEGSIAVLEIQADSGRRLPIADFLRGNPLPVDAVLV